MIKALRHSRILGRALIALLLLSFVLAPFHSHSGRAAPGDAAIQVVLADGSAGHGHTVPDPATEACPACAMLKQLQISHVADHPVVFTVLQNSVSPVRPCPAPRRLATDLFRPPIHAPV